MGSLNPADIRAAVVQALAEDVGPGDATSLATLPPHLMARARMIPRESCVLAGRAFAETAFQELDPRVQIECFAEDGQALTAGQPILRVAGPARALLTAERVALNFVQRLTGIATLTARFVQAVAGTHARILDTRKTTPGWRLWEKYAVRCGGGCNHRAGLYDLILIKDNHLAALSREAPSAVAVAVQRARQAYPQLKVQVEADTLEQVHQALEAGADMILLDNMSADQLRAAVKHVAGRALTEASGGIQLANVRSIALTGVDRISVGALTHSAPAVDLGLDWEISLPAPA